MIGHAPASSTLAPDVLPPGAVVGDHVIVALRSEGGFAHLYSAREARGGATVAVKVLRRALAFRGNAARRFRREIEALQRLSHPGIVRILAHGELPDGRPWLSMEWLEGCDLGAHLRAAGALDVAQCVALFAQLTDALEHAHGAGIVHRDLKAENVMVRIEHGALVATLVDFGIAHWGARDAGAHRFASESILGSACSMAPEQILGEPVDERTDVYALGVLLFRAATGVLPFRSADPVELEEMHLRAEPPAVSALAPVPPALDALVRRCMAKNPSARPPRPSHVLSSLRAIAAGRAEGSGLAAVHVEVVFDGADDDPDDAALADAEGALTLARTLLAGAGLLVSDVHAAAVLGVGADAHRLAALATGVVDAIEARPRAAAGVGVAVTVHVAATGDELGRTGTWARRERGAWHTTAAIAAGGCPWTA